MAAQKGHHEITRILLDGGADLTVGNITDDTPLHEAAHFGKIKVVKVLTSNPGVTPEFLGAKNASGNTAAHFACMYGRDEVLEELIRSGDGRVDLEAKNLSGETPLHLACYKGHPKCIRLLAKAGVDVEAKAGKKAATPLFYAMEFNNLECAAALVEGGANPENVPDSTKRKLLLNGSKTGNVEIVDKLMPYMGELDFA